MSRTHTYNIGIDKATRKTLLGARKRLLARSIAEVVRRQTERLELVIGLEAQGYVLVAQRADGSEQVLAPMTAEGRKNYLQRTERSPHVDRREPEPAEPTEPSA